MTVKNMATATASAAVVVTLVSAGIAASQPDSSVKSNQAAAQAALDLQSNRSSDTDDQSGVDPVTAAGEAGTTSSSSYTSGSAAGSGHVSVTVNGQDVSVPANGSTQKTVSTPDGTTNVSVSSGQTSDGNNFNASFTSTNSNSTSVTSSNNFTSEQRYGSP